MLEGILSKDNRKPKKWKLLLCHESSVLAAAGAFPEKLRTQLNVVSAPVFQRVEMQWGGTQCTRSSLPETAFKANQEEGAEK